MKNELSPITDYHPVSLYGGLTIITITRAFRRVIDDSLMRVKHDAQRGFEIIGRRKRC